MGLVERAEGLRQNLSLVAVLDLIVEICKVVEPPKKVSKDVPTVETTSVSEESIAENKPKRKRKKK